MDIGTISQIIGSLGFPIAASVYMAYINEKQDKRHAEETSALRTALENNTSVITQLKSEIETRWQYEINQNKEEK